MNARFYLPGLGRFASADIIVSDPTDPQSFNRFSYVRNNPIRFSDPFGYCGADMMETMLPNGDSLTEQDTSKLNKCIGIRDQLEQRYKVTIEGTWALGEIEALEWAFLDIEAGFRDVDHVRDVYSGTIIRRLDEDGEAEVSLPINVVKIRNGTFRQGAGLDAARFILIHELVHRMDLVHGLEFSLLYEHRTGGRTENVLGNTCTEELAGSLSGACEYYPGRNILSRYANTDRREDFADSAAAYLYGGNINGLTGRNTNHGLYGALHTDRAQVVQDLIDRSWAIFNGGDGGRDGRNLVE